MRNRWRHAALTLAISSLTSHSATAATLVHTEATHDDGRYTLSFEVVLDAERGKVWRMMTDYEQLPRLSDVVTQSHIVKSEDKDKHRLDITFHACVLIFCKTMKKVVDIQAWPQSDIVIIGDPQLSDFSYSVERWRIFAEKAQTRLRYSAEMTPDFFIPPLIGPWLMKSFLQKEIMATAIKVEEFARRE